MDTASAYHRAWCKTLTPRLYYPQACGLVENERDVWDMLVYAILFCVSFCVYNGPPKSVPHRVRSEHSNTLQTLTDGCKCVQYQNVRCVEPRLASTRGVDESVEVSIYVAREAYAGH